MSLSLNACRDVQRFEGPRRTRLHCDLPRQNRQLLPGGIAEEPLDRSLSEEAAFVLFTIATEPRLQIQEPKHNDTPGARNPHAHTGKVMLLRRTERQTLLQTEKDAAQGRGEVFDVRLCAEQLRLLLDERIRRLMNGRPPKRARPEWSGNSRAANPRAQNSWAPADHGQHHL